MAKITKDWIESGAIGSNEVLLENDSFLKGRNAADDADIDILKVNGSDALVLGSKLQDADSSAPTLDAQLANKKYVDDQVATISIPSVFELKGNWNANTNTPTLANTDTSVDNFLYYVNVSGSTDFGAGSKSFDVGDWVYNVNGAWEKADNNDDVLSVNGQKGAVVLDTDDITEGVNKYVSAAQKLLIDSSLQPSDNISELTNDSAFVDASGAKAAAVINSTAGSETDQAPSVAAMKAYADNAGTTATSEKFTLTSGDITNQYVTLSQTPIANSVQVIPVGGPSQEKDVDFTLSGAQVNFAGDIAANAQTGDKYVIYYSY